MKLYLEEFIRVFHNINLLLNSVYLLNQPKMMIDRDYIAGVFFSNSRVDDLLSTH